MPNSYFQFKQFLVNQADSGMKVTTDGCLFGAWVAKTISNSSPSNILDIGAGTGLLSLMIAQKSKSKVHAVEIDQAAFKECIENFKNSPWKDRITGFHGSIQNFRANKKFDVIVSNPPYYEGHQISALPRKNLAQHVDALSSGALVDAIEKHLKRQGSACVMYPDKEFKRFTSHAKKVGISLTRRVSVYNQVGKDIFRVFGQFSFESTPVENEHIFIRESNGEYTHSFREFLHEYYLHLDKA